MAIADSARTGAPPRAAPHTPPRTDGAAEAAPHKGSKLGKVGIAAAALLGVTVGLPLVSAAVVTLAGPAMLAATVGGFLYIGSRIGDGSKPHPVELGIRDAVQRAWQRFAGDAAAGGRASAPQPQAAGASSVYDVYDADAPAGRPAEPLEVPVEELLRGRVDGLGAQRFGESLAQDAYRAHPLDVHAPLVIYDGAGRFTFHAAAGEAGTVRVGKKDDDQVVTFHPTERGGSMKVTVHDAQTDVRRTLSVDTSGNQPTA